MRTLFLLSPVFMNLISWSQSANVLIGARSAAMGYASSVLRDEASLFNNPGALAGNNSSSFFAYETNVLIPGANRMAAGILLSVGPGTAGMGLFRFGDELYNEQFATIGYGNQLGIASLGIRMKYIQYHADGFQNKNAIGLDFGGLAQITPQISFGAYIVNLNQAEITPGERLPTRLIAGIGFRLEDNFLMTLEIDKDINFNPITRAGFEYNLRKKFFFRSGFNLHPNMFSTGLGARIKKLQVDYAFVFSQALGDTHQASAIVRFGKAGAK